MKHKIPNLEEFRQAVADGWVREFKHDTLPLVGFVYSFKCEMMGWWNEVTRYARGIVFDSNTGELVAFPFPKFFNLNKHEETKVENLPDCPFTATTKEDGSLIIVFNYKSQWICSTKGSFHSEQANWANAYLKNIKDFSPWHVFSHIGEHNTYLFEGIYPTNRIVVDYKGFEGFKFLASFWRNEKTENTEHVFMYISQFFPCAKHSSLNFSQFFELCKTMKGTEQEGFVLKYPNGLRVKIKSEDYCSLHRLVTNATPLSVWEQFDPDIPTVGEDGSAKPAYLADIPDEFLPKIIEWDTELRKQYQTILDCAKAALADSLAYGPERKNICIHLQNNYKEVMSLVISLMDGKMDRVKALIIDRIRPTANEFDAERRAEVLGKKS